MPSQELFVQPLVDVLQEVVLVHIPELAICRDELAAAVEGETPAKFSLGTTSWAQSCTIRANQSCKSFVQSFVQIIHALPSVTWPGTAGHARDVEPAFRG